MELRENDGSEDRANEDPGSEGFGEYAGIDCNSVRMALVFLYFLRKMINPATRKVTKTAMPIVIPTYNPTLLFLCVAGVSEDIKIGWTFAFAFASHFR